MAVDEVSSGGIEAPATFEDAFAADDSPASDPQPDSSTDAQPAAGQPESTGAVERQASGDSERSPFIPRERFDEVNTKLNELKTWKEQRAWAEQVDPQAFQQMTAWYTRAMADPRGFATGLLGELAAHPEHAQAIRSEVARILGTRQARDAEAASPDQMPQADVSITDAQGNEIGRTYSEKQLAKRDAFMRQQMLSEVDQKFAPHLQSLQKIQEKEQQAEAAQQAQTFATTFGEELAKLPLFAEHKAEIGNALAAMRLASDHPSEVQAATFRAYHQVVGPKLANGGKTQQDVLADLQRKAHASSSVNPGSAASAAPHKPGSFFDESLEW